MSFVGRMLAVALQVGIVTLAIHPPLVGAATKSDPREKQARQAFAVGQYKEALELFGALYADTLHPTYLRNIGRSYQNLGQPEKAINAFKDYLRLAKGLPPSEKIEIEGYIAEMELLKKQQSVPPSPEPAKPAPIPIPAPTPQPETPTTGASAPTSTLVTSATTPPPTPEVSDPFYTRGWFWGVVTGVVVLGVVGTLWATGTFSNSDACDGRTCFALGERR